MNSTESVQIVQIIGSIYTNYKPMNMEIAVEAWRNIFFDVPYDVVAGALYSYARDNKEFPPTPGQLNAIINQAEGKEELSAQEAWSMVLKATKNGLYGSKQEFDKLPEEVQKAVGSPEYIREIAMMEDPNMDVEMSHFNRAYREVLQRKKNVENLPENVKQLIERAKGEQPVQIVDKQSAEIEANRVFYTDALQVAERKALADSSNKIRPIEELHPAFRKFLATDSEEEDSEDGYAFEENDADDLQEIFA